MKNSNYADNNDLKQLIKAIIGVIVHGALCILLLTKLLMSLFPDIKDYAYILEHSKCSASMTYDAFISECKAVDYETLERYPNDYEGEYLKIQGEVTQVIEGGPIVKIIINVGREIEDSVYVMIDSKNISDRILEKDRITIYGVGDGLYTYTSIMDKSITLPLIYVTYYDIDV